MKNSNFYNSPIRLLPVYFKKIGLVLVLLTIAIPVAFKLSSAEVLLSNKDLLKIITKSLFMIGLTIIGFSKDKIEDEMTMIIRMKAIIMSFIYGLVFAIISPLLAFFTDVSTYDEASTIFIQMLMMYLIWYSVLKYFR
jgi:hypothetical protein